MAYDFKCIYRDLLYRKNIDTLIYAYTRIWPMTLSDTGNFLRKYKNEI